MGYREKVTKELKHLYEQTKQNLAQKAGPDKPREGKGMTRRVRACLKRLEKKIPLHNGLPPEKQIRFYSLWHNFKLLARVPTVTPFSRCRTNRLAS